MKFTTTITAIVAFLPIALAAPAPVAFDNTIFNETMTHENELPERKLSKNSGLTLQAYRSKGCAGVLFENVNVQYDAKVSQPFPYKSYKLSRSLLIGETLNLMSGSYDNDKCAVVTSFTPQRLKEGCHELGGDTAKAGSSQCFKLWRHQGFIYPS